MCMDADTVLDDGFLAAGVQRFTADRALMAIGGLFYGEAGHGVLGQLQQTSMSDTPGRSGADAGACSC